MKIVGLITEYNPFHNGHAYHLRRALEETGADAAVCVMSGDFVQRGEPAVMSKHLRAEAALAAGASAVFMLPVRYSCATAALFANAAVRLLDQLGCVDFLCFGTESRDVSHLAQLAKLLADEPPLYKAALQSHLKKGDSFPSARQKAILSCLSTDHSLSHTLPDRRSAAAITELLTAPNNILAIEYMIALKKQGSRIRPVNIPRVGSLYHDKHISGSSASASAVRQAIRGGNLPAAEPVIPRFVYSQMIRNIDRQFPVWEDDLSIQLQYELLRQSPDTLRMYPDISRDLAQKICRETGHFHSFSDFVRRLKSKDITHSRISRSMIHILLGLNDIPVHTPVGYARLLGIRHDAGHVLSHISSRCSLPLLASSRDFQKVDGCSDTTARSMLREDLFAARLYSAVIRQKFKVTIPDDTKRPLLKK